MKKIILIVLGVALLAACKKSSSGSGTWLLSKIIVNGDLQTEYVYNAAGQITQEKYYEEDVGVHLLKTRYQYSYDANGNPTGSTVYRMPSNELISKYDYTVDAQGRISRNTVYDMSDGEPGEFSTYIDYDYDANGHMTRQNWKGKNEKTHSYREFKYFKNGNLRSSEVFYIVGLASELQWSAIYAASDTTVPAAWKEVKVYPVNFYFQEMIAPTVGHLTYNGSKDVEDERHQIMSNREYNSKGLMTKQTITMKRIKPVAPDEVTVMQYEYVQR